MQLSLAASWITNSSFILSEYRSGTERLDLRLIEPPFGQSFLEGFRTYSKPDIISELGTDIAEPGNLRLTESEAELAVQGSQAELRSVCPSFCRLKVNMLSDPFLGKSTNNPFPAGQLACVH